MYEIISKGAENKLLVHMLGNVLAHVLVCLLMLVITIQKKMFIVLYDSIFSYPQYFNYVTFHFRKEFKNVETTMEPTMIRPFTDNYTIVLTRIDLLSILVSVKFLVW